MTKLHNKFNAGFPAAKDLCVVTYFWSVYTRQSFLKILLDKVTIIDNSFESLDSIRNLLNLLHASFLSNPQPTLRDQIED